MRNENGNLVKRSNENSREQIKCIPINCTVFKRKYVQYKYYMFAKYCGSYIIYKIFIISKLFIAF